MNNFMGPMGHDNHTQSYTVAVNHNTLLILAIMAIFSCHLQSKIDRMCYPYTSARNIVKNFVLCTKYMKQNPDLCPEKVHSRK